jgi:hypothetical protein
MKKLFKFLTIAFVFFLSLSVFRQMINFLSKLGKNRMAKVG